MSEDRLDKALEAMRKRRGPWPRTRSRRGNGFGKRPGRRSHGLRARSFVRHCPDYSAGKLSESRRLLMEDHLARCADCRKGACGNEGRGGQSRLCPRRSVRL